MKFYVCLMDEWDGIMGFVSNCAPEANEIINDRTSKLWKRKKKNTKRTISAKRLGAEKQKSEANHRETIHHKSQF